VSVVRDITEDLALREQLVRGERMSAVGELISGVVHELDEPLRSAIGAIGHVLEDPAAGSFRAELERAHGEAVRIDAIVQSLRAFIRTAPAERLVVDLNDIVSSMIALRAFELSAAGVEMRADYGRVPLVYVNREEIQQVLLNLLINAQYSIAKASGRGVLIVRTSSSGADALVDVIDDGPGIPAWAEGRVFEPFFTTKDAGGGTGLGLSTALGIATSHGGTLALVPSAHGAWFRLTLPGAGFPGPVHAG
jgi:signal transduction histidine kinase